MKRAYKVPKAVLIDFTYDEQVTAQSAGNIATYGDPKEIGRCQQSSMTECVHFWNASFPGMCKAEPYSLRDWI